MTVTNSRTLIEMRRPSLLFFLWRRVRRLTSSGKGMCYQYPSGMEYPPAPSRQLSPKDVNVGIRGMMWAMGVSQVMSDSGRSFSRKKLIFWRIVLFMFDLNFAWCIILAALFIA